MYENVGKARMIGYAIGIAAVIAVGLEVDCSLSCIDLAIPGC